MSAIMIDHVAKSVIDSSVFNISTDDAKIIEPGLIYELVYNQIKENEQYIADVDINPPTLINLTRPDTIANLSNSVSVLPRVLLIFFISFLISYGVYSAILYKLYVPYIFTYAFLFPVLTLLAILI